MVYILLADGFEEIEAIGTVDILRRAGIPTKIVAIEGDCVVASARNVKIVTDVTLKELDPKEISNCQLLVLPGGGIGVENLAKSEAVKDLINQFAYAGKKIAAICAAPTLLGSLGLLKDKTATCYPGLKDELMCGKYSEEAVVVDGNIITSRGAGTTHLFAAKIVEILLNKETADDILAKMIY